MSFGVFAVLVMLAMAGASSVEARGARIVERFSRSATTATAVAANVRFRGF